MQVDGCGSGLRSCGSIHGASTSQGAQTPQPMCIMFSQNARAVSMFSQTSSHSVITTIHPRQRKGHGGGDKSLRLSLFGPAK